MPLETAMSEAWKDVAPKKKCQAYHFEKDVRFSNYILLKSSIFNLSGYGRNNRNRFQFGM